MRKRTEVRPSPPSRRALAQPRLTLWIRSQAYNTLKDQKANAETALRESEETVKAQQGELKRLNYRASSSLPRPFLPLLHRLTQDVPAELEIQAAHAAAPSKIAEEKAALEKRVHALTTELQRAQLDLEKEKQNRVTLVESTAPAASRIARPVRPRPSSRRLSRTGS